MDLWDWGFVVAMSAMIYASWRLAKWERKLITDWLASDRSTPPPTSAFFPPAIARQWWIDYELRARQHNLRAIDDQDERHVRG